MSKMRKNLTRWLMVVLLAVVLVIPSAVYASTVYSNPETLRTVTIDDGADLLTAEEEAKLAEIMKPITSYGEVGFLSVSSHSGTFRDYAENYYYNHWNNDSGALLVIDMQERELTILTNGSILSVVTSGKCNSITDNIYRYASRGDYYGCAEEAFSEVGSLLNGHRIAEPMRYITSALLALLIALLINFVRVRSSSRLNAANIDAIVASAGVNIDYTPVEVRVMREERIYSPLPKNTGGPGGGGRPGGMGGGGFGGGGGGFSGGGGSHKF